MVTVNDRLIALNRRIWRTRGAIVNRKTWRHRELEKMKEHIG